MKVLIDIYDELYDVIKREKSEGKHLNVYERAIMDGVILPTHGRLIDADEIVKKHWWADGVHGVYAVIDKDDIDQAPTVLEASKE